jgi:predicted alpha/beta superfamily hydrolase
MSSPPWVLKVDLKHLSPHFSFPELLLLPDKYHSMTNLLILLLGFVVVGMTSCNTSWGNNDARIDIYAGFMSAYVEARQIEVLVPDDYNTSESYDVIYVHDGQNVFNHHTSYSGVDWAVDDILNNLINKGEIRPVIVVAIWNTQQRLREYMPAQPREGVIAAARREGWGGDVLSDNYLRFIVEELKPFIDSIYRTHQGPEGTFIMGSSMGGLISLYAVTQYPHVFGGAACLSAHWPALGGVFLEHLAENLPPAGNHRFYFDYGTRGLDAMYEPFQQRVDDIMKSKGFNQGRDFLTLKFEGADHNEAAWAARVHHPLKFLLQP